MSEDATTRPTIETVLEKVADLRDLVLEFKQNTEARLTAIEAELVATRDEQKRQALQLDKINKHMHEMGVDLYDMRHEFLKTTR